MEYCDGGSLADAIATQQNAESMGQRVSLARSRPNFHQNFRRQHGVDMDWMVGGVGLYYQNCTFENGHQRLHTEVRAHPGDAQDVPQKLPSHRDVRSAIACDLWTAEDSKRRTQLELFRRSRIHEDGSYTAMRARYEKLFDAERSALRRADPIFRFVADPTGAEAAGIRTRLQGQPVDIHTAGAIISPSA